MVFCALHRTVKDHPTVAMPCAPLWGTVVGLKAVGRSFREMTAQSVNANRQEAATAVGRPPQITVPSQWLASVGNPLRYSVIAIVKGGTSAPPNVPRKTYVCGGEEGRW